MTTKQILTVGLAVGILAVLPLKFGTNTRGNVFKKGTRAPAAATIGFATPVKTFAAMFTPIDWANPKASEFKKAQHPNKPKRREE